MGHKCRNQCEKYAGYHKGSRGAATYRDNSVFCKTCDSCYYYNKERPRCFCCGSNYRFRSQQSKVAVLKKQEKTVEKMIVIISQ